MLNNKIFLIRLWPIYTAGCYGSVDKEKKGVLVQMMLLQAIMKEIYVICDRKKYAVEFHLCKKKGYI